MNELMVEGLVRTTAGDEVPRRGEGGREGVKRAECLTCVEQLFHLACG